MAQSVLLICFVSCSENEHYVEVTGKKIPLDAATMEEYQ